MELIAKLLIFIGTAILAIQHSNGESIVNIGYSQVRGLTVNSQGIQVAQYLGIPYAEAPIYANRFKKPQPKTVLPAVVLAYDQPAPCWQASKYPFPIYDAGRGKNEDCLYLNIWTPEDAGPQNKKTVIYYVHGGGFRFGSVRQPSYFGAPLAALGDVVVVTVNYRVGAFGFLTSGTDDAPGNVGLWDILEGLKWVNKNIEYFGGDPSKITIAGDSAGSDAVGLLTVSPLAEGLFLRQIMQGGSPAYRDDNNKQLNLAISQLIAEGVNCADKDSTIYNNTTGVVACLRRTDPSKISQVHSTIKPRSTSTFLPQFGDDLLPASPRQAIANGDFECKDLLIGNTNDEGSHLITTDDPKKFGFFGQKNPRIDKPSGQQMIRQIFRSFTDPESVVNQYLNDTIPDDDYDKIRRQVYTSAGDFSKLCPTKYYAEKCADQGQSVFYYLFKQRPSDCPWAPWMGVPHGSEIEFVFGKPIIDTDNYFQHEVQFSAQVIDVWTSFAKYGKPSLPWPRYSRDNPDFVYLGPGTVMNSTGRGPNQDSCDFFRGFFGFN